MPKPHGRHPHQRLTAVGVKRKKPGKYADGNGLYLVVDDSGARRWILRTVVKGKRRDIGLGSVALVGLAEARDEAAQLRRIARAGGDPVADRHRRVRHVPTFAETARQVHTLHTKTLRNARHRASWISSLEADIFPVFGDRPVDQIDTADVLKVLTPIWTTKAETARRIKQRVRTVLDWAKASGYREGDNPADTVTRALPKQQAKVRHLPAMPYVDVPTFLSTLRDADGAPALKLAFEFLILTAARTSEVLGAAWNEIDQGTETWTVPGERIKAGREHRVPLALPALAVVKKAFMLSDGGPYVFPGRRHGKPLSNMALLMVLRRLGRTDITAHGFRSSFRDWAAERTSAPRVVAEAALAHVIPDKVEAAYLRSDLFEHRRKLMTSWADFVTTRPKGALLTLVSYLLHSGDPKMLWSRRGPAPALSRPGRGPAPTTEETPALLLRRPSGGLWMQRGRLVSEDHCTPMGPACLPQTRTATGWGYLSQVNS